MGGRDGRRTRQLPPGSGGGGSGQAGYGNWTEASVIQNGIQYSPEQWHRKQMSERIAAVEAKLDRYAGRPAVSDTPGRSDDDADRDYEGRIAHALAVEYAISVGGPDTEPWDELPERWKEMWRYVAEGMRNYHHER